MLSRTFWLVAWVGLLAAGPLGGQNLQELQQLVDQSEDEEEELEETTPSGDVSVSGRPTLRARERQLSQGEAVDRLRISQDREIDPSLYIVGPGDVLQLYVWGQFDRPIMLQVNPEGHALVPTIGDFFVSGPGATRGNAIGDRSDVFPLWGSAIGDPA